MKILITDKNHKYVAACDSMEVVKKHFNDPDLIVWSRNGMIGETIGSKSKNEEDMVQKKYEITDIQHPDSPFIHRIRALIDIPRYGVKAGDLGGYIHNEWNLSQDGDCWVGGNACVFENAWVYENALACGDCLVGGHARIYGNALIGGNARVRGNACVFENAHVSGNAQAYENARIYGNVQIYGQSYIGDDAHVNENA
jgi:hypothetical protein